MSSRGRNIIDLKKGTPARTKVREAPRAQGKVRPVRLKTRRRNQRIYTSALCLLAGIGMIGILGAATHIQQLAVGEVKVHGAQQLAPESLTQTVKNRLTSTGFELFSRKNIFLYPKRTIEADLAQEFPRIKTVSIARESLLASAIVVAVEERAPYASWCPGEIATTSYGGGSSCFVLDSRGFIFAEKTESPELGYTFEGGLAGNKAPIGQVFLEGRLHGVIALLQSLEKNGFPPSTFTVTSEKDFAITLMSGQQLLGSFEQSNDDFLRNLMTTLEAEGMQGKFESLQYIDLRFGNRVYYK